MRIKEQETRLNIHEHDDDDGDDDDDEILSAIFRRHFLPLIICAIRFRPVCVCTSFCNASCIELNICGSVHHAFVVKIIPTRCNNCVLFFANAFTRPKHVE